MKNGSNHFPAILHHWNQINEYLSFVILKINDTRMVSPNASTILLITVQLLGFAVIFNYPQSVIMFVQAWITSHLLLLFNGIRTTFLPSFTEGRALPIHYKQVATAIATICQLHTWYSSYLPFRISILLFNLCTYDNWPCSAEAAGFEPAGHFGPTP